MKRPTGWLRLLWPLSVLYSMISHVRAWCYARGIFRKRKLPGTVISVGNLTAGGTGKTPMVLWIAERLAEQGRHAAILTRGYRGTSDAVAKGEANAKRDADIVLLDASDPFGGGRTLPSGRLREPVSALRRADLVVITRSLQTPAPAIEGIVRRHTKSPIFYATTQLVSVLRLPRLDVALPPEDSRRARFLAFCGIGNPSAFFGDLRAWGFQVVGERSFADHHVYSGQEISELEKAAADCGADALLCTEKDVWNLRHVQFSALPVYCCRISFQLPANFWETLMDVVHRKQAGPSR